MAPPGLTPSQTIGPFHGFALPWPGGPHVVAPGHPEAIRLQGQVVDGEGAAVADALVEIWQADRAGRFPGPGSPAAGDFRGFGRCPTDTNGCYTFTTVKPGPVAAAGGGLQAPHVDVSVFARGLLRRLVTRIYFADEAGANAADPVLRSIEDPARRATLVATGEGDVKVFDIRLQGDGETVFLAL